ncbi:MAG: primosomal protein N', partial [Muribaculaceae bacterium]|nr:primosomal protein N' [Muribaculaceae bacterium]
MSLFADVILPLPLYSTYTYSIPEEWEQNVAIGCRVLVQFGRRKFYTGIVNAIHRNKPEGYDIKPIVSILDEMPVVRHPQMKLWDWISSYYLCSPGEVFKAAMPTGLKPESETYISLNSDSDIADIEDITEAQATIINYLSAEKRLTIGELQNNTGYKNIIAIINPLLNRGIIEIAE